MAKGKKKSEQSVSTRQISVMKSSDKNIFLDNRKTISLLKEIATAPTKFDAVSTIIDKTPDGKMAMNVYLRLANQGIKVELHNAVTGKTVKKYDRELRDFTKDIGKIL